MTASNHRPGPCLFLCHNRGIGVNVCSGIYELVPNSPRTKFRHSKDRTFPISPSPSNLSVAWLVGDPSVRVLL